MNKVKRIRVKKSKRKTTHSFRSVSDAPVAPKRVQVMSVIIQRGGAMFYVDSAQFLGVIPRQVPVTVKGAEGKPDVIQMREAFEIVYTQPFPEPAPDRAGVPMLDTTTHPPTLRAVVPPSGS